MTSVPCFLAPDTPEVAADRAALWRETQRRKASAFRPGTLRNHQAMFRMYIGFCIRYNLQDINPSTATICMYAQYLSRSFASARSIRNYVSGVRLLHKFLGIQAPALYSFELDLVLRSLDINLVHVPNQRLPITEEILSQICRACQCLGKVGIVLRCGFLFGFYGMLRQSNLAPPHPSEFNSQRHTCRGDVIIHPPGLILIIKWGKCNQKREKPLLVPLPEIPGHHLCPKRAYTEMVHAVPNADANSPLLQMPLSRIPFSTRTLATCFSEIITHLGYSTSAYSLHSLRRGGATAAFSAGVDHVHIKRHGGWASDAFWTYISTPASRSPIPQALARQVSQTNGEKSGRN